jgi:polar amino acid transport system substrate-binding protein
MTAFHFVRCLVAPIVVRLLAAALAVVFALGFAAAQDAPLKVAVYDAPPYGHVEPDGSIDGVSVELWRRAAESLGRQYHLLPVAPEGSRAQGL